jgi:hypothetical protein
MFQIGTVVIGLPVTPDRESHDKFIMKSNNRRLEHMRENGMMIDEYSEDAWNKFKNKENK